MRFKRALSHFASRRFFISRSSVIKMVETLTTHGFHLNKFLTTHGSYFFLVFFFSRCSFFFLTARPIIQHTHSPSLPPARSARFLNLGNREPTRTQRSEEKHDEKRRPKEKKRLRRRRESVAAGSGIPQLWRPQNGSRFGSCTKNTRRNVRAGSWRDPRTYEDPVSARRRPVLSKRTIELLPFSDTTNR